MNTLNKRNPITKAVKYALVTAASITALSTSVAYAAEEDEEEESTITVTGSRIKRTDIELAAPVQVITMEDIAATGLTSIGDILQNIPAAGSALNTTVNNGGDGSTNIDLRNLGSNRLLVLVNGRRWAAGIGGSVDLNNIPVSAIERVEVLKDGASAIYGSDAISGVINIITKTDFEGVDVEAYTSQYDEGDGKVQHYNFSMGTASEKGSTFINVSYTKADPVMAGDRPISAVPVFGAPTNYAGSSGTPLGRFLGYSPGYASFFNQTLTGVNGDLTNWVEPTSRYNYAPENYLLTPQERINLFATANYEIAENLQFRTEIFYGNRKSDQLLAPTPLFIGLFGSGLGTQTVIGANNPYNPYGFALDSSCDGSDAFSGPDAAGCLLLGGRRQIEAGHRNFVQNVHNWQWSAGLDGEFNVGESFFTWDFNYTHANISQNDTTAGLLNMQRVNYSLSDDCVTDTSCVPYNFFGGSTGVIGEGTITQEMIDYTTFIAQDSSGSTTNDYTFNISGDLFEMGGGTAAFAAGLAKSDRAGFDQPDALIAAGITSGNSRLPTSGAYSLNEAFVEISLPIITGLEVGIASRYSDYSNFGSTTNSKLGIKYDITDTLALRATYSEAFRAPTIAELFQGNGDSYPQLNDPCNDYQDSGDAVLMANCAADGVPEGFSQANSQIRITVGGNTDLGPEEAESQTMGIVFAPMENLSMTLDWYSIEIVNAISSVGAATILDECYNTTERALCGFVTRSSAGNIADLYNGRVNVDTLTTEGFDLNATYQLETSFGEFNFNWDTSYVMHNSELIEGVDINYVGRAFSGVVLPRIKSNLSTVWTSGDLSAAWNVRYLHHTTESCYLAGAFDDRELCNMVESEENKLASTTYHDMQVSYNFESYSTRLVFGINNIGDKAPPFSVQAFANSFDPSTYDVPGRVFYLRMMASF
ncbi:MAG: iron complex outermembrane receptor protein [Enterobacterales bacterium]